MTLSAAVVRELVDAGLEGQALVDACERIESGSTQKRSSAAERQARYRERKASQSVTRDVTLRNNPALDKEIPHTPKEINPSPKENPPKGGQKKRASRIPDDFEPDIGWAMSQGLSQTDAQREAANFRDYWTAKARDNTKLDWPATWRTWVRNSLTRQQPRGSPSRANPLADAFGALAAAQERETHDEPTKPVSDVVRYLPAASR